MSSTGRLESIGSPPGLQHSLLPAPSPDSSGTLSPSALSPALGRSYALPKRKRATVTVVACQTCRKRKTKCDGARPVCSNCAKRYPDECIYDYDGHETRTTALKRKIIELQKDVSRLNKAQSSPSYKSGKDTKRLSSPTASDVSSSTQSRSTSPVSTRPKAPEEASLRITVRDLDSEVKRLRDLLNLVLTGQNGVAVPYNCQATFPIATELTVGEGAGVSDWMPGFPAASSDFGSFMAWSPELSSGLGLLKPINLPLNMSTPGLQPQIPYLASETCNAKLRKLPLSSDVLTASTPITPRSPSSVDYDEWAEQMLQAPLSGHDSYDAVPPLRITQLNTAASVVNCTMNTLPLCIVQPYVHKPTISGVDPVLDMLWQFYCSSLQKLDQKVSLLEILGPSTPELNPLIGRSSAAMNVATWASKFTLLIVNDSMPLSGKFAIAYTNMLLMRWHIWPSEEAYNAIPEWLRPLRLVAGLEGLPVEAWPMSNIFPQTPVVGDVFVRRLSDKVAALAAMKTGRWPYDDTTLFSQNERTFQLEISPQFAAHVVDIANWTSLDVASV